MTKLFHDEERQTPEPLPGIPQALPEGETILWQGRPRGLDLAVHAFHLRFVFIYFIVVCAFRLAGAATEGSGAQAQSIVVSTGIGAALAAALLVGIGWLMARSTVYTLTNKRIVLRYGVAIRKYVNLPFSRISAVALKVHGNGSGDISFASDGPSPVSYLHLWPHVRPMRFSNPEPMLRALADPRRVADAVAVAMRDHAPGRVALTGADQSKSRERTPQPQAVGAA